MRARGDSGVCAACTLASEVPVYREIFAPVDNSQHSDWAGDKVRGDVQVGANGRLIAEDEDAAARLVGSSGRQYDLLAVGAHGLGRQPFSQLGGVVARVLREVEKDVLIVRDDRPLADGRYLVCVDGSSYSYKAMRVALQMAQAFGGSL